MKKFLILLAFASMGMHANAQKQYAGVFKADSGFGELVTTFDKSCDCLLYTSDAADDM
jgi:hypothetical protein